MQARFFATKPSKGGTYFKRGVRLITRSGCEVGTVAQDRASGLFALFAVDGRCEEFPDFASAELWAWQNLIA